MDYSAVCAGEREKLDTLVKRDTRRSKPLGLCLPLTDMNHMTPEEKRYYAVQRSEFTLFKRTNAVMSFMPIIARTCPESGARQVLRSRYMLPEMIHPHDL